MQCNSLLFLLQLDLFFILCDRTRGACRHEAEFIAPPLVQQEITQIFS